MHTSRLWLCAFAFALPACSSAESNPSHVAAAGATFPAPLYDAWASEFTKAHPKTPVWYESVGSSKGIEAFLAEEVDLGASDSALTDEQLTKVTRGALMIPATAGSIVIAYNPAQLPPGVRLPRAVYVDILLGKITNWNDPRIAAQNPGSSFPDLAITGVVRSDGSGTTFALTNHLSKISAEWEAGPGTGRSVKWPASFHSASGNDKVAAAIKGTRGAVGYVEYGVAKRAKLAMAALENRAGEFVSPTGNSGLETLSQAELPSNLRAFFPDPPGADSYPIVTFTWLLAYERYSSPEKAEAVRNFLRWSLTDGQERSESLGFIRLSPRVAKAALAAVERIKP